MADSEQTLVINSLIGEGSEFRGEFRVKDLIRIDGFFKGNIITDGKVLIGKTGTSESDIRAGVVVIGGTVKGSIHANIRAILLSTAVLHGDIVTPSLVIEDGVKFEGRCTINR